MSKKGCKIMKVVVQKVNEASVKVDGNVVGEISRGLLVFVGFTEGDNLDKINFMVNKIINLRIFEDSNDVMNLSVKDVDGGILSISQFTLYGDAIRGNRPSYIKALKSDEASILYEEFNKKLKENYEKVETGIFQADMKISLINDGPTTIIIEK
jgi:D-tyrosyl-tRNA(Tyr) deacylase